ncbi:hypothetical protein ACFL5Z_12265 [Planctomycetota bacterium]
MMNVRKIIVLLLLFFLFGASVQCYGLATEQIGPDTQHPTVARQDWPKGIVEIPRHPSRVYSTYGMGNENFYFKTTVGQINESLALFAKARMRDHVVRIEPGAGKISPFFDKEEIEYNVQLQIVSGVALALARGRPRDELPLEPRLTILTGTDNSIMKQLKWPGNVIVESKIRGVSINKNNKKQKRDVYYGLFEFADGSPPVRFVENVNSRITLWEKKEEDGIDIGSVNHNGYFTIQLSKKERADLKDGTTWLTITISDVLVKAQKTDQRFPVEMLTKKTVKARPVRVVAPTNDHGERELTPTQ